MEAVEGPMPVGAELSRFGFEIAWGGRRALTHVEGGRVRVRDATDGADLGAALPELRALGLALGTVSVTLDGELIVPAGGGRPDAGRLGRRLGVHSDSTARRLARTDGVVYLVSDLLWLEGHPTVDVPYRERRRLLDDLALSGAAWQVTPSHAGEGPALLAAARAQELPGVVAKRLGSTYRPGPAPGDWIAVAVTT
jgi:bifunctional non-homologous end joining protein LigD